MSRKPGLIASGIAAVWMLALLVWVSANLPAGRIPLHWNAQGLPDRLGSHQEAIAALVLLILLSIGVGALLAVIPAIEPRRLNLARSARAYTATWIGLSILLPVVYTLLAFSMVNGAQRLQFGPAILVAVGALIAFIGNYLGKVRSNFFFGIRTPWTLSSDLSWSRTHRVGGRLFIALGILIAISALLPAATPWVVIIGVLGVVIFLFVYSYREWARDPQKLPIGR